MDNPHLDKNLTASPDASFPHTPPLASLTFLTIHKSGESVSCTLPSAPSWNARMGEVREEVPAIKRRILLGLLKGIREVAMTQMNCEHASIWG